MSMFSHRLVHLDLKGAPLRVNYLQQLMPFLSRIGINGLLIEYEDMFPFNDFLSPIKCKDVYRSDQIETIISMANQNNLKIIPLIQTFGHLEFVLKHDSFRDLREVESYPNSICPSNEKSFELIKEMLTQMINFHKKWTHLDVIHIGCDEVWHLGHCHRCRQYIEDNNSNKTKLFIDFVTKISDFVINCFGIKVIIWDDMIRNSDTNYIIESKLNLKIEPMVWHYLDANSFGLTDPDFWQKYKQLFPHIWIATAFKGATKMNQMIPPIGYHISNHLAWIEVIRDNQLSNIAGVVLTGWQRFDHFTALCELFPNAVLSLLMSLFTLNYMTFSEQTQERASKFIGSQSLIPIVINRIEDIESIDENLYPGAKLYKLCLELMFLSKEFDDLKTIHSLDGTFTSYQIRNNRTNPLHIEGFLWKIRVLLSRLCDQRFRIETEMKNIFFESTIEEWIETNINPLMKKMEKIVTKADQQMAIHMTTNQTN